eukprot:2492789-Amphidinium_carterae.1
MKRKGKGKKGSKERPSHGYPSSNLPPQFLMPLGMIYFSRLSRRTRDDVRPPHGGFQRFCLFCRQRIGRPRIG